MLESSRREDHQQIKRSPLSTQAWTYRRPKKVITKSRLYSWLTQLYSSQSMLYTSWWHCWLTHLMGLTNIWSSITHHQLPRSLYTTRSLFSWCDSSTPASLPSLSGACGRLWKDKTTMDNQTNPTSSTSLPWLATSSRGAQKQSHSLKPHGKMTFRNSYTCGVLWLARSALQPATCSSSSSAGRCSKITSWSWKAGRT